MPIKDYTTRIDAHETVMEIQKLLAQKGAKYISLEMDEDQDPVAVSFTLQIGKDYQNFLLKNNWVGVLKAMEDDRKVPRHLCNGQQAFRTGWRIVLHYVQAAVAYIEAGQAVTVQVFMPYAVIGPNGETMFDRVAADPGKMLKEGRRE